jgi:hypothetical protein
MFKSDLLTNDDKTFGETQLEIIDIFNEDAQ